jgi:hypothetical protein
MWSISKAYVKRSPDIQVPDTVGEDVGPRDSHGTYHRQSRYVLTIFVAAKGVADFILFLFVNLAPRVSFILIFSVCCCTARVFLLCLFKKRPASLGYSSVCIFVTGL